MKGKKKIVIIHFLPLAQYPPVMNLIEYLGKQPGFEVVVISNGMSDKKNISRYESDSPSVKIYRPGKHSEKNFLRYFNYLTFYLGAIFRIFLTRPSSIIYYETISGWPALMYKKFKPAVHVMVHYHEYTNKSEYQTRMWLSRVIHDMEMKQYHKYSWISQTNEVRLEKFRVDCNIMDLPDHLFHTLPNYPPAAWTQTGKPFTNFPVRLVYVGSLGLKNMYLEEVLRWIGPRTDSFTLDIYAYNINDAARDAIGNANLPNVRYHGGVDYYSLPDILPGYDVGVGIYKPFSENTVHAVSNKVFEYFNCGLDVWFSTDMTYTYKFVRDQTLPKILPVDFSKLDEFDDLAALNRQGLRWDQGSFTCESIYAPLADQLLRQ